MDASDHILIVDDDAEIHSLLSRYLVKNGLRATAVPDGRGMWQALDAGRIDLIVLDLMLPGDDDYLAKPFSARELLARIKAILRRACLRNHEGGGLEAILTLPWNREPGTPTGLAPAGAQPADLPSKRRTTA